MDLFSELRDAVIYGNREKTVELTTQALEQGTNAEEVLNGGLIPGMDVVGEKFKNNEFYLPEMLIAARAMQAAMEIIKPILVEAGTEPVGRMVVGTVKGDIHDIGKNLVAMMLEGAGFEVVDLGIDVSPEKFVAACDEHKAQGIGLSAMLTTTMGAMKTTIEALIEAGKRDQVKVFIGGAPITDQYAQEIGADGYAADAATAVEVIKTAISA